MHTISLHAHRKYLSDTQKCQHIDLHVSVYMAAGALQHEASHLWHAFSYAACAKIVINIIFFLFLFLLC